MSGLQLVHCTYQGLHEILEANPRLRIKALCLHHADYEEFRGRVPVTIVADRGDLKARFGEVNLYANERVGMLVRGEVIASLYEAYEAPDAKDLAAIMKGLGVA